MAALEVGQILLVEPEDWPLRSHLRGYLRQYTLGECRRLSGRRFEVRKRRARGGWTVERLEDEGRRRPLS